MIGHAFEISSKIVLVSLALLVVISIILIFLVNEKRPKGRSVFETLIIFPMFLPPSAIGYIILKVLGKNSAIGGFLYSKFNFSIIFTLIGAVIVGVIVGLPIMYKSLATSCESIAVEIKDTARALGANEFQVFYKITLPLCKEGLLTGLILSFARIFGEFGATILVAGNIPEKTQTVPMAIYYAIESGNDKEAIIIFMLIAIVSVFLVNLYNFCIKRDKS